MKNIDNIIREEINFFLAENNILTEWNRPAKGRKKARQMRTRYGGNLSNQHQGTSSSQGATRNNTNSQQTEQTQPSQVNYNQEDDNNAPYTMSWSGDEVGNSIPQTQANSEENVQSQTNSEQEPQQQEKPINSEQEQQYIQQSESNEEPQQQEVSTNNEQEQQNSHINSRGINLGEFINPDENNALSNALYRLMKQKYLKNTTVTFSMIRQLRQIGW